ncbi:MAG: hypothetical protein R3E08_03060 [Thiotrichaceae bacterium]
MQTAQKLYEGIDVGKGAESLITYMRADSGEFGTWKPCWWDTITQRYGAHNLPRGSNVYKTKSKNNRKPR